MWSLGNEPRPNGNNKVWQNAPDWIYKNRHVSCVETILVAMKTVYCYLALRASKEETALSRLLNPSMNSCAIFKLSAVPSVQECQLILTQLLPGAHLAVFAVNGIPYYRMAVNLEDAGFEIRDQIVWVGDPHVQIALARKPLEESTVATNVLKYGTGGINVDTGRIGTEQLAGAIVTCRFPANVILTKAAAARLDQQSGTLKSGFFSDIETRRRRRTPLGHFRFGMRRQDALPTMAALRDSSNVVTANAN